MRVPYIRSLFAVSYVIVFVHCTKAQQGTTQLWLDGTVGQTFASYYKGELELGYRSVVSGGSAWKSLRAIPRISTAPTAHWTFMASGYVVSTDQEEDVHSLELRGQLGARYNFTPFKRMQTRLNVRYEFRNISTEGDPQQSQRLRIRAEAVLPLDTRNYRSDTMWYALGDVEAFSTLDHDPDERFSDRLRARLGLGRKFSYNMYVEAIYNWQRSHNNVEDDDLSTDQIIRLRFKYYFSPRVRKLPADVTSP